jgi:nucleoside-diphosphate-sugar epimerase
MKSKNLAEKAAWDYLNSLPESQRFELIVLNPSICIGPTLTGRDFASGLSIKKVMSGKIPGTGKFMLALVDVRDAAESHLRAILAPSPIKSQRIIIHNQSLWLKDFAILLKDTFPGYGIKTKEFPYCTVKLAAMFDDSVKIVVPYWGKLL